MANEQQQQQGRRQRRKGGAEAGSSVVKRSPGSNFATISLADGLLPDVKRAPKNPTFMVAAAAEKKSCCAKEPIPQWRYTLADLAAGATAGCAVEAALYPLDTIKTRMQASLSGGGFKALFASGGGKGLYAGVLGNLVGVAPASAIFMACYEPTKLWVQKRVEEDKAFLGPLTAGAVAGVAASFVRVPTEVIKQRMQTGEFTRALKAVSHIAAKEGTRGFYAGYWAFLLRDLPFDAIEFFAYEQLKVTAKKALGRECNALETALIGATAGAITGVSTTPFDVLKTRLMTQGTSGQYKGVIDATIQIAQAEGVSAFFKGWEPRVIWISIGGCVFFSALEQAKKFYSPPGAEVSKMH